MQLHRNNTEDLMLFSVALEKIATGRPTPAQLLAQEKASKDFKDLQSSKSPLAPAKAFAAGFGLSFAVPLALNLTSSDTFNRSKILKHVNAVERQTYLANALTTTGIGKQRAKELASAFDATSMALRSASGSGDSLYPVARVAMENLVQKELVGDVKPSIISNYKGKWVFKPTGKTAIDLGMQGIKQLPMRPETLGMAQKWLKTVGADSGLASATIRNNIIAPTSEAIVKDQMPMLVGRSREIISSPVYEKLYNIGKDMYEKKEGRKWAGKGEWKEYRNYLKKNITKAVKMPLVLGILGGGAAVASTYKKRKKYQQLVRRANARK